MSLVNDGSGNMVSFRNVAASEETGYVPAPVINMQNLNLTVDRVRA